MPAPGGSPFGWLSSGKKSLQKNIFTHQPSPKLRTVPDGFGFVKLAHAVKNFPRRYSKELNFLEARERKIPFRLSVQYYTESPAYLQSLLLDQNKAACCAVNEPSHCRNLEIYLTVKP